MVIVSIKFSEGSEVTRLRWAGNFCDGTYSIFLEIWQWKNFEIG